MKPASDFSFIQLSNSRVDFFKYRQAQQTKVDATVADTENGAYPV